MEEERKEIQSEEGERESRFDEENSQKADELPQGEDESTAKTEENELESVATELLEKHPEIFERLKAGEELFNESFFENINAGMSPSAAFEHEELKSRLAASIKEAERYKELYKTESRLRRNKERSSGSLKGESANETTDYFELGFLED